MTEGRKNDDVFRLAHLNLTVSDADRSTEFYRRWFGFDRILAEYGDGTRFITNTSGFELALHQSQQARASDDWHFGFLASDAEAVRLIMSAMAAAGLATAEPEDTGDYVGFKCHDPDGHIVEVYFEPR